jgi:hypothetical protein
LAKPKSVEMEKIQKRGRKTALALQTVARGVIYALRKAQKLKVRISGRHAARANRGLGQARLEDK